MFKDNECIEWVGVKNNGGYGALSVATGRTKGAHHVAWYLKHGKWPVQQLLHSCDNPSCVNWEHLREGSQLDNRQDCVSKGRTARGERHPRCKLTDEQVVEMRSLRASGLLLRVLAERFQTPISNVSYICRNETRQTST